MKIKRAIVIFNLCMIGMICAVLVSSDNHRILQVPVLKEKEWEEICQDRQEKELEYTLYFDNVEIPWYSSGLGEGYLISQDMAQGWKGALTVSDGYELVLLDSAEWRDKETAIREMRELPFLLYNEEFYCKGTLYATGLPVMVLSTDRVEEEKAYGQMVFFDGKNELGGAKTSQCEFHVRGLASRAYYKMGYKLNLLNENGEKEKLSLAGMREDDDWILRAMGLDESKIREKLATDLWNEMNTFGSYEAEYVELFLDGAYEGLYLLQEPLDFKTLGLSSQDNFIVRMKIWPENRDFWADLEENGRTQLLCGEFEIDNRHLDNLDEVYEILEEWKRMTAGESTKRLHLVFDEENIYKLDVFLQMIVGMDNTAKNQFLIISRISEDSYEIRKLPWDMDMTFGQNIDLCVYESFSSLDKTDCTVELWMETMPEKAIAGRQQMYRKLRDTVLREQELLLHVEELYASISDSGALTRENAAWDKHIGREQTEFVEAFILRRLAWMDEYYGMS